MSKCENHKLLLVLSNAVLLLLLDAGHSSVNDSRQASVMFTLGHVYPGSDDLRRGQPTSRPPAS